MKTRHPLIIAAALLALAVFLPPARAYNEDALLAAIAMKETGAAWNGRPGSAGELSKWHITARVWRQHMGAEPFANARREGRARECAHRHLAWLASGLRRHGYEPTPERLALAWNRGLTGAISRGAMLTSYAEHVGNLYHNLNR